MFQSWHRRASKYLRDQFDSEMVSAVSTPNGIKTLYGTCYSMLGLYYLGVDVPLNEGNREFLRNCQNPETGFMVGPELIGFRSHPNALHDLEHLSWHSTCAALPVIQQYGIELSTSLKAVYFLLQEATLKNWLDDRDMKNAWFEGNNIFFAGQFLVYLRDVEGHPDAESALRCWFDWLDRTVDPETGLWGTNGLCSPMEAVYGGYHQLLVYYHENHRLPNPKGLVDTVLSLGHSDGGFNPNGNGGACEDVDSVDILVNCYKRFDYRRSEVRLALWRCVDHILETQNTDGGFPYNRNQPQSHMGIPGTQAGPNVSCTFPTWFRIHTLALAHEIIPEHPQLAGIPFRFNKYLSMGWHKSPEGWYSSDPSAMIVQFHRAMYMSKALLKVPRKILRRTKRVMGTTMRQFGIKR
jgi:hypothetical protein